MSYANVAKENRLPESQQPHPDPNLLEGHNKPETQLNAPQAGEVRDLLTVYLGQSTDI